MQLLSNYTTKSIPLRILCRIVNEKYEFTEIIVYSVYILVGGMRTYAFYSNECSNNVRPVRFN